ncbi:MAG TPA: hypothetical protein VFH97_00380 [Gemmatimonadales bacterium]|nr:hypothetical protein [Gemmatimonadales bacterium]
MGSSRSCIDLSVSDVRPDVEVEPTLAQYLAGQDPAMEAVLRYRR